MRRSSIYLAAITLVALASTARGETAAIVRPKVDSVKALASCELQSLDKSAAPTNMVNPTSAAPQPVAEDALANYQRTPLGDWQMPGEVNRDDPWLRFLLLCPRRPLVIDVAVFVDGKPYANGREAWIDDVLAAAEEGAQKPVPEASAGETPTVDETASPKKKSIKPAEALDPTKVTTQSRKAPTMRDRLLGYVGTMGTAVDRQEIRWLIAEWGFGPPVVVLNSSLSWQRAAVAPLFAFLDRDRSGSLEAAEIAQADESLHRADADANDVVDESEIRRLADSPPVLPFATGHSLLVAINDATDWDALAAEMASIYGASFSNVKDLASAAAHVTLRVDFTDNASDAAGIKLLTLADDLSATAGAVSSSTDVITLDLGAEYIEFSAGQDGSSDKADIANTQVAVGAVIDGNPLLRMADLDLDHRLSIRERQQLTGLLTALDRDHDGHVGAAELPIPIRFALTLGPQVHAVLAKPAGAARTVVLRDALAPPSWFAGMDKNGDRDVSRGEFLGTSEQFGQFDADGDGLLSTAEALKMDAGD